MTDRKKKGIGFLISGVVFAGVGTIFMTMTVTPDWVGQVVMLVGVIANALGFKTVFPDMEE